MPLLFRLQTWLSQFFKDSPADIQAEYLRHLYGNSVTTSLAAIFATLYLYVSAQTLPGGQFLPVWVSVHVSFHSVRLVLGLIYLTRSTFPAESLHAWGVISVFFLGIDGAMVALLALQLYPLLEFTEQLMVVLVVLILVGSTAYSLSGRWSEILSYATPVYMAFAWATWPLDRRFAKTLAVLILVFYALYVLHARNRHRSNVQSFSLAQRNGELAEELKVKNTELEEVASARSRLLATVSHDLRQPSHAIGLLCERVMLEPNPAFLKDALRDLNELSQSLSASLTTLMDLTRLDAALVKANIGPVALNQVLLRLEAEFSGSARNKGLVLHVPHSDLWIRSDPVLLHGVLANLVSNAIKYTRAGRVEIELSPQGEESTLSVRDTGMGIKADKLELIFKEFVRLEGAESGTEGLGLGLSIVRRYAALLRHPLSVSSEPLRGSCFSIRVPVIMAVASQAEVQALSRSAALGDLRLLGLRVLVVDNVDLVLSSMVRTLSAWGCEVHAARSLSEACAVAHRQVLDVVISDFHLGDEEPDGLMLITTLRTLNAQGTQPLPALLMTGDVSGQLEAEAGRNEVGILHKPVRPAVLQNRLLHLLQPSALALRGSRGLDISAPASPST